MPLDTPVIIPLHERALLVSFGHTIDVTVNKQVQALDEALHAAPFPGFIETVPAYSSLTIFYSPVEVLRQMSTPTAYAFVVNVVQEKLKQQTLTSNDNHAITRPPIIIPVLYNGPDLEEVARQHQLSVDEVIQLHTGKSYRVFMLGFMPGFPYLGLVDDRIATPRRSTPRTNVLAGSVGIAGSQTGIYPHDSPGGWNLIGQTPLRLFRPGADVPALLQPGDEVFFQAITEEEFQQRHEYPH